MAQVFALDIGVLLVGLALHALPYTVGDRFGGKAAVETAKGRNCLGCDRLSSLPLVEHRRVGFRVIVARAARCEEAEAEDDEGGGEQFAHPG